MRRRIEKKRAKGTAGYTLLELMVAGIVGVIILYGFFSMFSSQRKAYMQQTELTNNQSNLRTALYYLFIDLSNAGYTGLGMGLDNAYEDAVSKGGDIPARAIRPVAFSEYTTLPSDIPYNQSDRIKEGRSPELMDVITLWGNFYTPIPPATQNIAHLTLSVNPGGNVLNVDDIRMFQQDLWDDLTQSTNLYTVQAILIGFSENAEYHEVSSVTPSGIGTGGSISLVTSVSNFYAANTTMVVPIYKRRYMVREINGENWLVRVDEYIEGEHTQFIANDITDFQISYLVASDTNPNLVSDNVDPNTTTIDPCLIRGVRVMVQTLTPVPGGRNEPPTVTEMSRMIRIYNTGLRKNFMTGISEPCPGGEI